MTKERSFQLCSIVIWTDNDSVTRHQHCQQQQQARVVSSSQSVQTSQCNVDQMQRLGQRMTTCDDICQDTDDDDDDDDGDDDLIAGQQQVACVRTKAQLIDSFIMAAHT